MTDPFLKFVGGKRKLVPEIRARLPSNFADRRYIEPFVGGGAVFFALQPKNALLADVNQDLIHCYAAVRDHVDELVRQLKVLEDAHGTLSYYSIREWYNTGQQGDFIQRAAWFIYLNKTCFNGVHRVNRKGEFNVPIGRYTNPSIVNEEGLRAASKALQGVDLLHSSFEALIDEARAGDFVYLDPPYVPVSSSANFTSYAQGGFSEADQRKLAEVFSELDARGCKLMLSNSDTPLIRKLYSTYACDMVLMSRSINSDSSSRGHVKEVLIRNYLVPATFPVGPCGESFCICSGGPHVACGVAKERDQSKRDFLLSLGK
jgi:DNA adenine methylase